MADYKLGVKIVCEQFNSSNNRMGDIITLQVAQSVGKMYKKLKIKLDYMKTTTDIQMSF